VVEIPTATVQAVVAALLLLLLLPLLLPWMQEQVRQLPMAWLELTWNQLAVFGNLRLQQWTPGKKTAATGLMTTHGSQAHLQYSRLLVPQDLHHQTATMGQAAPAVRSEA